MNWTHFVIEMKKRLFSSIFSFFFHYLETSWEKGKTVFGKTVNRKMLHVMHRFLLFRRCSIYYQMLVRFPPFLPLCSFSFFPPSHNSSLVGRKNMRTVLWENVNENIISLIMNSVGLCCLSIRYGFSLSWFVLHKMMLNNFS